MKKAIVVGGAGFVGSAVVKELLYRNIEVTVVVRQNSNYKLNERLEGLDIKVVECDLQNISNLSNLLPEEQYDVWYQFAWDGLFNDPLLDYTIQINNIKYLMDSIIAAKQLGCKKFIGAGSISQYELQTIEGKTSKYDKHRIYKTAKLACEYMGQSVANDNGISFFWPIITNIYGEGEKSPRLINSMIRKLLNNEHQALSEGNQIYDFLHISDAARAFCDIGKSGKEFRHYVLGSGNAKPLKEFLIELRDIVNPTAKLGFGEMQFNGIYLDRKDFSIAELQDDTGFTPKLTFKEGIQNTMAWIKTNR